MQGTLADLTFTYDEVGNPFDIVDATPGAEWSPGSKPVAHLSAKYDDAYRLKEVDRQYAPQGQALLDDVAISPLALEAAAGNRTFPTVAVAPNRLRQETFLYDSLGNLSFADDDAHLFDRSFGVATFDPNHPNRVASLKQGGVRADVSYDDAGDVTRIDLTRDKPCAVPCAAAYGYEWDELGRLSGAFRIDALPGQSPQVAVGVSYVYDGADQRVLKIVGTRFPEGTTAFADIFDTLRLAACRT